ncbi:hypothetical protein [Haloarcula litorea]|uniref:hypothetical protein n=1 Tax=Haloarcula litorea TaxID=3032579 RepID=UPI0023E875C3|nr:hypothetical protein [Halomicroarcula sp. GDY20]
MSDVSRLATGTRLRLRELTRTPTTLAMLLALPPVIVETYGVGMSSFPQLPGVEGDLATVGRLTGALFAVAFLAGIVGLFQVISARHGDERLAVAGFPRASMLAGRLLTMSTVGVAGAAVALGVLSVRVDVAAPGLAVAALVSGALIYGLLGVVVGTLLPRELEGSIALVFLADVDNALSAGLLPSVPSVSIPVFGDVSLASLAPLFHSHELFAAAVLDGTLAAGHLRPVAAWLGGLLALAFLAYTHSAGDGVAALLGRWRA